MQKALLILLAFQLACLMPAHLDPSWQVRRISHEECFQGYEDSHEYRIPHVTSNIQWEKEWKIFRGKIRDTDTIIEWTDPIKRARGFALERNGEIVTTFVLVAHIPIEPKERAVVY